MSCVIYHNGILVTDRTAIVDPVVSGCLAFTKCCDKLFLYDSFAIASVGDSIDYKKKSPKFFKELSSKLMQFDNSPELGFTIQMNNDNRLFVMTAKKAYYQIKENSDNDKSDKPNTISLVPVTTDNPIYYGSDNAIVEILVQQGWGPVEIVDYLQKHAYGVFKYGKRVVMQNTLKPFNK